MAAPASGNNLQFEEIVDFFTLFWKGKTGSVSKVKLLEGLEEPTGRIRSFLEESLYLSELLGYSLYHESLQDMVLADDKIVTVKEFNLWFSTWKQNQKKGKRVKSLKPPPRRRALLYNTGETKREKWVNEQLLVPRKQRGSKPMLSREEEEEEEIIRAASVAQDRLKGSSLNRCPTGRLPGLGTTKSESVLKKVAQERDTKTLRSEEAERVYNDWLFSKLQEKNKNPTSTVTPAVATAKPSLTPEEKAARKAEAERQFELWKKRKATEKKKQQELQRAEKNKLLKDLVLKKTERQRRLQQKKKLSETSPVEGSIVVEEAAEKADPLSPTAAVILSTTPVEKLGQKEKKRLAPYFVQLRKEHCNWLKDSEEQVKANDIFLSKRCLKRLSRWYASKENARKLMECFGPEEKVYGELTAKLGSIGFRVSSQESLLLFKKFFEQDDESQNAKFLAEIKEMHESTPPLEVTKDMKFSPCVIRLSNALGEECLSSLDSIAAAYEDFKKTSRRALAVSFSQLLEECTSVSSSLLDKDIQLSCAQFWKAGRRRTVANFVTFVREANLAAQQGVSLDDTTVTIEVDDFRASLRDFYKAIPTPRTSEAISCCILALQNDSEMEHPGKSKIEGTVWLDLFKYQGFPDDVTMQDSHGEVSMETFVEYWMERHAIYQRASLCNTSPTHKARCQTASRRGRRKSRPIVTSPSRSNSPTRVRFVKSKRQVELAKEREKEMQKVYCSTVHEKRASSAPLRNRLPLEYVQLQALKVNVKSACSSLATATTEQIVEVLNVQQPSKSVSQLIGAVCILVEVKPTWKHARRLFKNWAGFISLLTEKSAYPPKLTTKQVDLVTEALESCGQFSNGKLKLLQFLERWVDSLFSLMKNKGIVAVIVEHEGKEDQNE